MRNMSFSMTTEQVRNKTKTVTRRFGWWGLKPGERLWAIKKGQGLKKGEKVKRICQIEVISVRKELCSQLYDIITNEEVKKEGFPNATPDEFLKVLYNGVTARQLQSTSRIQNTPMVNRIEFKYL